MTRFVLVHVTLIINEVLAKKK